MSIILDLFFLLVLFFILGVAADQTVKNIKYLAAALKLQLFAFGILLGLITTLPELSVGINTTINNVAALSVGNLLGGIIVIFGFVLGCSLLLNDNIETDGNLKILIPEVLVIFSPILLGLDGSYGRIDGLIMILLYCGLIYYLYKMNHSFGGIQVEILDKNKILSATLLSIVGIIFVLLTSGWIVEIAINLLQYTNFSKLAMGMFIFAIGTNLPEITIAITSWRKKASMLSLSHILSSAFTNVLVLGIISSISTITFLTGPAFWLLGSFLALMLIAVISFYYSGKKMDRSEGFVLLGIYLLFLVTNFIITK